jgi:hypothetical protein
MDLSFLPEPSRRNGVSKFSIYDLQYSLSSIQFLILTRTDNPQDKSGGFHFNPWAASCRQKGVKPSNRFKGFDTFFARPPVVKSLLHKVSQDKKYPES